MAGFSDTIEAQVLNCVFRGQTWTAISTPIKVSLHTGDPGESGTQNEVTGGGYARQSVTFGAPSGGTITNTADVTFSNMPACTVTHCGLWDSNGTTFLAGGALTASKTLEAGDSLIFPAGNLSVSLD